MKVFIIGVTGRVGRLLAARLDAEGVAVAGLVRSTAAEPPTPDLERHLGDIGEIAEHELATMLTGSDAVVYTAGSNGGARETTQSVDRDGLLLAAGAAARAGVRRFLLVSVFPEAWRERDLPDDEEFYFAAKKEAEVALTRTDLDWLILRPSLLTDDPGAGRISLGPAELHERISREDVADTLAAILRTPFAGHQVLELNQGGDLVADEVLRVVAPAR